MRVAAYITCGKMVAYARREQRKTKVPSWAWIDSRECGGRYATLEEWMRVVTMEQSERVHFVLENKE